MSGKYDLVPFPEILELIEFLSNVGYVEGYGMFKDVHEAGQHLKGVLRSIGSAKHILSRVVHALIDETRLTVSTQAAA